MGLGKDYTIFSLIDGVVKFEKFGPDRKKVNTLKSSLCIIVVEKRLTSYENMYIAGECLSTRSTA